MEYGIFYTEQNIITAFRNGREGAFDWVYNNYYDRLFSMATRFLREPQDAEDIIADAFVRLWNDRDQITDLRSISVQLFLFVKHRCYDVLRHRSMKLEHHQQLLASLETHTESDLIADLTQLELFKRIYAEAENLPDKMKEVFFLTYKTGMKPSEIAAQLGLSVQTVKNQRLAAVKMLKNRLSEHPLLLALLLLLQHDHKFFS